MRGHADQVTSSIEKNSILRTIAARRMKSQNYATMDCRRPDTDCLISILTNSQSAIVDSQPIISYYNHVVYAFLQTKLDVVGCTLDSLNTKITAENDSSLPTDLSVLTEIMTTLSDKGIILSIQDLHSEFWVIVNLIAN